MPKRVYKPLFWKNFWIGLLIVLVILLIFKITINNASFQVALIAAIILGLAILAFRLWNYANIARDTHQLVNLPKKQRDKEYEKIARAPWISILLLVIGLAALFYTNPDKSANYNLIVHIIGVIAILGSLVRFWRYSKGRS